MYSSVVHHVRPAHLLPVHILVLVPLLPQSTGNFITLRDATSQYSADATRFALADAGDSLENANFERKLADSAILKLTKEEAFIREVHEWDAKNPTAPLRTGDLNFFDRVFLNEINVCIANADSAYAKLQFREALKYSWFQLQNERDAYKLAMDAEKNIGNMHVDVLRRYIEVQALLLSPLCPHYAQHVWEITGLAGQQGRPEFISFAAFPTLPEGGIDALLSRKVAYLRGCNVGIRRSLMESLMRFGKSQKPKAGEKPVVIEKWILEIAKAAEGGMLIAENVTKLLTSCTLYIAAEYPEWQVNVLKLVSAAWDEIGRDTNNLPDRKLIIPRLKTLPTATDKKSLENSTKFAQAVLEDLALRGAAALELESPFNERELLEAHMDFVLRDLGITDIEIKRGEEGPAIVVQAAGAPAPTPEQQAQQVEAIAANKALPGKPSPFFYKK